MRTEFLRVVLSMCLVAVGTMCPAEDRGDGWRKQNPVAAKLITRDAVAVVSVRGSRDTAEHYRKTASWDAFGATGLIDAGTRLLKSLNADNDDALGPWLPVVLHVMEHGGVAAGIAPGGERVIVQENQLPPHNVPGFVVVIPRGNDIRRELQAILKLDDINVPLVPGAVGAADDARPSQDDEDADEDDDPQEEVDPQGEDASSPQVQTVRFQGQAIERVLLTESQGDGDQRQLAWWNVGDELVLYYGSFDVLEYLAQASDPDQRLATNPVWQRSLPNGDEPGFHETSRVWVNMTALLEQWGELPSGYEVSGSNIQLVSGDSDSPGNGKPQDNEPEPGQDEPDARKLTVEEIIQKLELDQLESVSWRTGYEGRHLVTKRFFLTTRPRTGLLKLGESGPVSLDDLPPLPVATRSFHLRSMNLGTVYMDIIRITRRFVVLMPDDVKARWVKLIRRATTEQRFQVQRDILDNLGHVVCTFNDPQQDVFPIGRMTAAVSIRDREKLQAGLERLMAYVNTLDLDSPKQAANAVAPGIVVPGDAELSGIEAPDADQPDGNQASSDDSAADDSADMKKKTKRPVMIKVQRHGVDVYAFRSHSLFLTPTCAIVGDWLVFSVQPQPVEAFILRHQKKYPAWDLSGFGDQGLAHVPPEFSSLTWRDPGKSAEILTSLIPWIINYVQAAADLDEDFDWTPETTPDNPWGLSSLDIRPVATVTNPLFPNVTTTVTGPTHISSVSSCSTRLQLYFDSIGTLYIGTPVFSMLFGQLLIADLPPQPAHRLPGEFEAVQRGTELLLRLWQSRTRSPHLAKRERERR